MVRSRKLFVSEINALSLNAMTLNWLLMRTLLFDGTHEQHCVCVAVELSVDICIKKYVFVRNVSASFCRHHEDLQCRKVRTLE